MSIFLGGSTGTIIGLQSSSHLNGYKVIIVHSASTEAERHCVFIISSSSSTSPTATRFVRVKTWNIRVNEMLYPEHGPSRYEFSSREMPSLTARPLDAIEAVSDSFQDRPLGYNYFSTWPPTYLFTSTLTHKKHRYSSLQLASTDLTHSLYSLYHLDEKDVEVHFTLNACDATNNRKPSIIARNLIILWLILYTECPTFVIAEIWFSLRLSELTYAFFMDAVFALTREYACSLLIEIGVIEMDNVFFHAVRSLMHEWVLWHGDLSQWKTIVIMREKWLVRSLREFERCEKLSASLTSEAYAERISDRIIFSRRPKGDSTLSEGQVRREIRQYFQTGCLKEEPKHPQVFTNPTFFQYPDKYDMHAASLPYTCSPAFCAPPDKTNPLHSILDLSLSRWIQCLRSRSRSSVKTTWTMFMMKTDYVPAFCMSLKRRHDFAFVENLCEITGLLPILQSLKGIVKCSVLTCSRQILDFHDSSQHKYVQRHLLNTPPEMVPALLGWRCLGCDGNEWKTVFPGADRRDMVQYMLWVPCSSDGSELSLDLTHSKSFELLFRSVRKTLLTRKNMTGLKDGQCRDLCAYDSDEEYSTPMSFSAHFTHPFVFLPIFLRDWYSNRDLSVLHYIPDDKYNAEFRDVLIFSVADQCKDTRSDSVDLQVASLELLCILFGEWGRDMISQTITSFHCDVYSIYVNDIPYYGLSIDEFEDNITFSWLMDKRRLHGAQKVQVVYGGQLVITEVPVHSIKCKSVLRSDLNTWIFSRNPQTRTNCEPVELRKHVLNFTRVDRRTDMDFIICNNSTHPIKVDIETGGRLCDIHVTFKKEENVQRRMFSLPYKLCAEHMSKILDEKNQYKVVVTIMKSGIELTSPSIVKGAQTKDMWFSDEHVPKTYLLWIFQQTLSPEERVRKMLNRISSSKQVFCRYIIYTMLHSAVQGKGGATVVDVDEISIPPTPQRSVSSNKYTSLLEYVSKRQRLAMQAESSATGKALLWRHEKTGAVGVKLKWLFDPRFITTHNVRHQERVQSPIYVKRDEMNLLVAVLESRSVGEVKQRKKYHDLLVNPINNDGSSLAGLDSNESNQMHQRILQLENGSMAEEQEEEIKEAMLILEGCKIGTSFVAIECWHGQVDLLSSKRSDSSKVVEEERKNKGIGHDKPTFQLSMNKWIQNMKCWFNQAQEYSTEHMAQVEQKLASLDMALAQGLPFVDPIVGKQILTHGVYPSRIQSDSDGEGMRVAVKCLVQGAHCRELLGKQELIESCANKALEIIQRGYNTQVFPTNDEEISEIKSTAERILRRTDDGVSD